MEYMALIHADEQSWDTLPTGERESRLGRYAAFAEEARAAGVMVAGDELAASATATTVRVRENRISVTDGPYAEVKEPLGGFFILDCATIEDAVGWAARIPGAEHGAVEVRPVHVDREEV